MGDILFLPAILEPIENESDNCVSVRVDFTQSRPMDMIVAQGRKNRCKKKETAQILVGRGKWGTRIMYGF